MAKRRKPNTARRPRAAVASPKAARPTGGGTAKAARRVPVVRVDRVSLVAVVLLIASPAVIIPSGLDRFVFGKLFLAALGLTFAFVAVPSGRLPVAIRGVLAAASGALLLSAAFADAPFTAFFGRAPRSEGVFVLAVYVLAVIAGARLFGPGRAAITETVAIRTMSIMLLAVSFLAVVEAFGGRPLSSDLSRPGSLLGNASDEGALAVLCAGPLIARALRRREALPIAGAVASVALIALSASRGALVGAVLVLIVLVATNGRARRPILAAAAALAVLVLAIPATRDRVLGISPLAGQTTSGRVLLWQESGRLLGSNWLLGVGPSQFENAIVGKHTLSWQREVGPANPPGEPHNILLQVGAAGGVLLLLVAIAATVFAVRRMVEVVRAPDDTLLVGAAAGLCGFFGALQFHLLSPGTTVVAALFVGMLFAGAAPSRSSVRAWTARSTAAVAGALAVLFLLASLAEVWLRIATDRVNRGDYASADSAFGTARVLRAWDADLPFTAFHDFVVRGTAGDVRARSFANRWLPRLRHIRGDEQVQENRAALLEATHRPKDAATLLDSQLRRDPYDPQLLLLRGVIYAELGADSKAIDTLRQVTSIDRTDPQPWHDLAVLYARQGRTSDAAAARATASRLERR